MSRAAARSMGAETSQRTSTTFPTVPRVSSAAWASAARASVKRSSRTGVSSPAATRGERALLQLAQPPGDVRAEPGARGDAAREQVLRR